MIQKENYHPEVVDAANILTGLGGPDTKQGGGLYTKSKSRRKYKRKKTNKIRKKTNKIRKKTKRKKKKKNFKVNMGILSLFKELSYLFLY